VFANFSTSDPLARARKIADVYLADVLGPEKPACEPDVESVAPISMAPDQLECFSCYGTSRGAQVKTLSRIMAPIGIEWMV
jgi:hypothetical protein